MERWLDFRNLNEPCIVARCSIIVGSAPVKYNGREIGNRVAAAQSATAATTVTGTRRGLKNECPILTGQVSLISLHIAEISSSTR